MKRITRLILISLLTAIAPASSRAEGNLPESLKIDTGNGVMLQLVLIKPGTFIMGSDKADDEKPMHKVTFEKPFYIGKYLVTQEQWQNVTGANPSKFKAPKNPVDQVSWMSATNFIARLSEKVPAQKFSLPTEAQWEYACRANSTTDYDFGDDKTDWRDSAWYYVNAERATHPVGEKKPNAWGLYDMHGNVWEWCQDVYHNTYNDAPTDGSAWTVMSGRVVITADGKPLSAPGPVAYVMRGGAWHNSEINLRCATRGNAAPTPYAANDAAFGLRIVVTPP